MTHLTSAIAFAFLILFVAGCASSTGFLHISKAEQAAYDAGMARPENSCDHGYIKKYYFVKSETGEIRSPYSRWDCIDKETADDLVRMNEETTRLVLSRDNQEEP